VGAIKRNTLKASDREREREREREVFITLKPTSNQIEIWGQAKEPSLALSGSFTISNLK
jgi:hypothetical protein